MKRLSAITLFLGASSLVSGAAAFGTPSHSGRKLLEGLSLPIHLPDNAPGVLEEIGKEVVPRVETRVPGVDLTQLDEIENAPDAIGQGYGHTVAMGSDPEGKMTCTPATVKIK